MSKAKRFLAGFRGIAPAALIAFASGCAGIHVRTDYSHSTDFSHYKTYSWIKVRAANSLWAGRIRRDVDAQLAAKGWREVTSGGEAAVAAFGATRESPTLETFYNDLGPDFGGWYWGDFGFGAGMATTQVVYTPVGSLVVDIFNRNTRHLIWRGVAREALSGNPEKNKDKLARAVADVFKKFPPPSGA